MSLPKIAVTMGDPAGVGPEVCLHLLQNTDLARRCVPIVFGDRAVLEQAAEQCGLTKPTAYIDGLAEAEGPCVLDLSAIALSDFETGTINAATGRAGYTYVEDAINAALSGQVAAVTTAPLNKEALRAAGVPFPGHTEIFAELTHAQRACMLQYSNEVRCVFVTTHVPYAEVPRLLTKERILDTLELYFYPRAALAEIRRWRSPFCLPNARQPAFLGPAPIAIHNHRHMKWQQFLRGGA